MTRRTIIVAGATAVALLIAVGITAIPQEREYKKTPLPLGTREDLKELTDLNSVTIPTKADLIVSESWLLGDKVVEITPTEWKSDFHTSHINYEDRETGEIKPIDIKFREENGEFIVDKASYEIKIPKKLNQIRFWANEKWVDIEPIGIELNVEGKIVDDPETSHTGNTIRFDNVYGQGIHLEFVCRTGSVKKYIVFDQKPDKFDWKFKLTGFDKDKHILWKPKIFDSNGKSQEVSYDIKGEILTKYLPEEFFDDAVYPVRTDTTTSYYTGAGDGQVDYTVTGSQPSQATWDTCHDANTGTTASYIATGAKSKIVLGGSSDYTKIYRAFFPIDTSGLGADAIISSATLKLYEFAPEDTYDGDGFDYVAVVETFQASTNELVTTDFEDCGSDNGTAGRANQANIEKGSADIDISGIGDEQYNDYALNETGLGWISKIGVTKIGMREGHDIEDNFAGDPGEANKWSGVEVRCSELTDTNKDPYLSVTYEVSAAEGNMFLMF